MGARSSTRSCRPARAGRASAGAATALTLTDLEGGANVSALLYRAGDPLERYCMPDTLKAQHVSRITAGVALYSDMGRVLASVTADSCGWHDTITGHATAAHVAARWGAARYQEARNDWRRSARDGLLVELAKHGLGRARPRRERATSSRRSPSATTARSRSSPATRAPARAVTLRFELDTLVVLCSAPHPLDPAPRLAPAARARCRSTRSPPPATPTPCAAPAPENERGFAATRGGAAVSAVDRRLRGRATRLDASTSPPATAGSASSRAGEALRIVDLHGNQAVDTLFFDAARLRQPLQRGRHAARAGQRLPDRRLAAARARRRAARDDHRRHLRPPRHARRRLLAGVQRRALRRAHAPHARLPQHVPRAGAGVRARPRQARPHARTSTSS